jgi:hypothetical protein
MWCWSQQQASLIVLRSINEAAALGMNGQSDEGIERNKNESINIFDDEYYYYYG